MKTGVKRKRSLTKPKKPQSPTPLSVTTRGKWSIVSRATSISGKKKGQKDKKRTGKKHKRARGVDDAYYEIYKDAPLLLPRSQWPATQSVNLYSKAKVVTNLLTKLTETQQERFREGCFGHLLDFKITKFPMQLFLHLARQQCGPLKSDEVWFNLEGKVHKFGLRDFAMIIGLNCGEIPPCVWQV